MTDQPSAEVFGEYSAFYDALYADKDYEGEVDFVEHVFERYGVPAGASVLDLGSGTGSHAIPLALRGHRVAGVDRAPGMVEQARAKAAAAGADVRFEVGDVRDAVLGATFDAVISMFAVMSYQLTNDDLRAAFETARRHLEAGGLFVFDAWFGPAVLVQQPTVTEKTLVTSDGDTITRVARPTLDVVSQTVDVAYEVSRRNPDGTVVERTEETHRVRFLFAQEIELLARISGFELVALGPFMDLDRTLAADDWNVSAVLRAV